MPIRPPRRLAAPLAALAVALALASPVAYGPTPAMAQEAPASAGRIAVTGTGEVERAPDFARVFVSVTNRGDSVAVVLEANRTASDEALAAIEARGVAREDVQTVNFQVFETPEEYDRNGEPRPVEPFTATHQLMVVLRDTDAVGAFAGEILALDAITFQSIAWGLERSEEAQDEAMRRAVADARRQAQVLADAAGITLGAIRRIGDGHVGGGPQPEMDRAMMRAASAPAVPIVPPARITFTAQIGMEWAIGE
ncbi:SIMPL domain-containing protein [Salinarimonas rosea]|uniref:SIMPL domain-containing protein n=1 Tax=Salinarimonas rosea TaxID=552063 RepID=UPI000403805F|nr:SIMPL domain-containing protein [Salinarimonas rosea]